MMLLPCRVLRVPTARPVRQQRRCAPPRTTCARQSRGNPKNLCLRRPQTHPGNTPADEPSLHTTHVFLRKGAGWPAACPALGAPSSMLLLPRSSCCADASVLLCGARAAPREVRPHVPRAMGASDYCARQTGRDCARVGGQAWLTGRPSPSFSPERASLSGRVWALQRKVWKVSPIGVLPPMMIHPAIQAS